MPQLVGGSTAATHTLRPKDWTAWSSEEAGHRASVTASSRALGGGCSQATARTSVAMLLAGERVNRSQVCRARGRGPKSNARFVSNTRMTGWKAEPAPPSPHVAFGSEVSLTHAGHTQTSCRCPSNSRRARRRIRRSAPPQGWELPACDARALIEVVRPSVGVVERLPSRRRAPRGR